MKLLKNSERKKVLVNGTRRGADHGRLAKQYIPAGLGTWLLAELNPGGSQITFTRIMVPTRLYKIEQTPRHYLHETNVDVT